VFSKTYQKKNAQGVPFKKVEISTKNWISQNIQKKNQRRF